MLAVWTPAAMARPRVRGQQEPRSAKQRGTRAPRARGSRIASEALERVTWTAPLRLRVRNPPPVFVGREREQALLLAALDRGPVTCVVGPGGLGKTSLVSAALHARSRQRLDSVLSFSASAGDRSGEQLVWDVLGALSELVGGRVRRSVAADLDGCVGDAVDWADSLDAILVLDDLHLVDGPFARKLLETAISYARRSRWICTSRAEIDLPDLAGQVVRLVPLAEAELVRLAQAWSPGLRPALAEAAARASGGSPFWLRHALARGAPGPRGARPRLLADLSDRARAWLSALASLEVPVRDEVRPLLGDAPTAAEVRDLERGGLLERVPEGLRLHGVARAVILDEGEPLETKALAAALLTATDPALVVESIRLDLEGRRLDRAVATATAHGDTLVAAGLAPRLWQLLEPVEDAGLVGTKLACALDLGGGGALAWAIDLPPPTDPGVRLRWVQALTSSPRFLDGAKQAEELATETADGAPDIAAAALVLAARAYVFLVRPDEAIAAVDRAKALRPRDPGVIARADAYAARAHTFAGRTREALALCASLDRRLALLDATTRHEVDDQRAAALFNLGRSRRAHDVFVRARKDGLLSTEQLGVRARLVRGSLFALELGQLAEARRLLDELAPVSRRTVELFAFYSMNEFRYWTALGHLPRAEEHLAGLVRGTEASGSAYMSGWTASPHHYLGILAGSPVDERTSARPQDFPLTRALGAWHEARWSPDAPRTSALSESDIVDAAIVGHLARSTVAALRDQPTVATSEARAGLALADEERLVLWQLDAQATLLEAILCTGSAGLSFAVRRLEKLATLVGPSRFDDEARFYREVARGKDADPAALDRLASSESVCAAARRSRALLGFGAPLDRVDTAIVERVRASWAPPRLISDGGGPRPGIGVDTRRATVWLPRGSSVDLSRRPIALKLLVALLDAGGRASKEQLVAAVWGVSDYHPLRDDKRLQVAVSRLRATLEDDGLIETTEDGYRISGAVPAYRV